MKDDDAILDSSMPVECPRCSAAATMTLLTSMTRYYKCESCEWRWQFSRQSGSDAPMADTGSAL